MAKSPTPAPADDVLRSPPVDPVGEDVVMARLQGSLFGEATRPTLERYALLEKLGEGSYGAVYSAWDPRLDRKVAIKVLHGGATDELEREARALAKLSHPNVVAVHDVGESAQALFLAMEFVDGTPLSAMDTARMGWRSIVATYRQAAAGLAAAHDAGIVHRDFKPANALLGADGRVRVLDFGLARGGVATGQHAGTAIQTRAGGTPRYMAPEQHRGDPVDARTDQYGFCAALWEALHGQPPFVGDTADALLEAKADPPSAPSSSRAPARISRLLQRGLAPDPAHRFTSMRALDAALGRTLQRRGRALAGLGIAGVALAVGVGLGRNERPCTGSDVPPPRWTDQTRAELAEAFAATGLLHAAASDHSTQVLLERWARDWSAARQDACMDHARGVQSAEGLDLRTACFDGQRERFDALLDVLLVADASAVNRAIDAAGALPSPGACADLEALRTAHPLPEEAQEAVSAARRNLARARAELDASHYARAAELAAPHLDACRALALVHPPTCVEARLVEAEAAGWLGRHQDALGGLREAAVEAQRAGLPIAFARAAANLTWELGEIDAAFDSALTWAALGHAALETQDAAAVSWQLLNNEGSVLATAGRWDEAIATHQRRLAALPEDSPLRMHSFTNLANIDNRRGRIADAEAAYANAVRIGEAAYGQTHPRVLMTRQNRAGMRVRTGREREGVDELEDVVRLQRQVLGADHPDLGATLANLSIAQFAQGDAEAALASAVEARRVVETAYGAKSPLSIDIRLSQSDALAALGRPDEAIQTAKEALALTLTLFDPDHANVAYALRSLGLALLAGGQVDDATAKLQRARSLFEARGMTREVKLVDSELAQSKASRSD